MKASEKFGIERLRSGAGGRSPFTVGLLIPTSGSLGLLGPSAYACARLACDAWNQQGGAGGREVRLAVLDSSEASARLDLEIATLIESREIDAIVNLSTTAVCQSVGEVVARRLPLVYTPLYEGHGLPGWIHAIGETPDRQLLPALAWMRERFDPKRWFLIGNDYCWPRAMHSLVRAWVDASGAEVVGERFVTLGEHRFDEAIEAIRESRADAVMISLVGGESVYLCRAFGASGLGSSVRRLSVCLEENAVLAMGADNTEDMFVAAGYFQNLDSDVNAAFKERYRGHFGDRAPVLNSLSQSVYEGMVHLQRQAQAAYGGERLPRLAGVRGGHTASDPSRDPVYVGAAEGLSIRVLEPLAA